MRAYKKAPIKTFNKLNSLWSSFGLLFVVVKSTLLAGVTLGITGLFVELFDVALVVVMIELVGVVVKELLVVFIIG